MTNASTRSIFAGIGEAWQRMLRNRRSMAELRACPPSELNRLSQDLGFNVGDLRSVSCSHPGPSELMPERLRQVGLHPAYVRNVETATYRDLERVCGTCRSWRRCARDQAKGDVQIGMREYCPNAATIDALLVDQPGRRRG